VPERTVASMGFRGGYSEENFQEGRAALMAWVKSKAFLHPAGEPFAVYWNSPMVPGFMKTFEVLVEVELR